MKKRLPIRLYLSFFHSFNTQVFVRNLIQMVYQEVNYEICVDAQKADLIITDDPTMFLNQKCVEISPETLQQDADHLLEVLTKELFQRRDKVPHTFKQRRETHDG